MDKVFYIYVHRQKDTWEVFYVGKGKGNRAYKISRNKWWRHIKVKHGIDVQILQFFKEERLAFNAEINLIKQLKLEGVKLLNQTGGGDGISGFKYSNETKQKIASSLKLNHPSLKFGYVNPLKGKKMSEQVRQNILNGCILRNLRRYSQKDILTNKEWGKFKNLVNKVAVQ